jgi:hypothetical protein
VTNICPTYLLTYLAIELPLLLIAQVIDLKPYVNSLKVHAQLSHNRLAVYGPLVMDVASLWPFPGMRTWAHLGYK